MDDNNQRPPGDQQQPEGQQEEQQYGQPPPGYQQYQQPPPYDFSGPNRPVGFLEAYKAYWKNFANFNDRTSRAGYWWVYLMNAIISVVIMVIAMIATAGLLSYGLGDPSPVSMTYDNPNPYAAPDYTATSTAISYLAGFGLLFLISMIWGIVNLVPGLAIGVRRLHDIGKSWVYLLFGLIPFAGAIILIVFYATAQKHPPENEFAYLKQV